MLAPRSADEVRMLCRFKNVKGARLGGNYTGINLLSFPPVHTKLKSLGKLANFDDDLILQNEFLPGSKQAPSGRGDESLTSLVEPPD
jgi:hypothetical protein